jgi:uncharacterized protein YwgA
MKRLARAAIVTTVRDELAKRGSWAGETHLQKGLFILQEGAGVPLEYRFILYKHGPFAFDLREDLTAFRVDGLLELEQAYPYGPRLLTTETGHRLQGKFPKTLSRYRDQIESVANLVDAKGVAELERIGTALLMIKESPAAEDAEIASMVRNVKPHVAEAEALAAIREIRTFLAEEDRRVAVQ